MRTDRADSFGARNVQSVPAPNTSTMDNTHVRLIDNVPPIAKAKAEAISNCFGMVLLMKSAFRRNAATHDR